MKKLLTILFLFSIALAKGQAYIGADGAIHPTGSFPVMLSNEAKGTPKRVKTLTQRDAIPLSFRDTGMLCWVTDSSKFYVLVNGTANVNWADLVASGIGGNGTGVTVETDPIFVASPAHSITTRKMTYWDTVGFMIRADSARQEIHDSIAANIVNYDTGDFSLIADTLHSRHHEESDPVFSGSEWPGQVGSIPIWNAKVDQTALDDTAAALRALNRRANNDTILFDSRHFYKDNTPDSVVHLRLRTINGQNLYGDSTDNIVITGGSGGNTIDTTGKFVTRAYVSGDSLFYVKGGVGVFAGMVNRGRFGIEDNTSAVNRSVDMQQHGLNFDNAGNFNMYGQDADGNFSGWQFSPTFGSPAGGISSIYAGTSDYTGSFQVIANESYAEINSRRNSDGSNMRFVVYPDNIKVIKEGAYTRYLPLSVNGNLADASGNITVSTGGGGGTATDTTSLSNRINQKLNITDTIGQRNADWNATSGVAQILNKPTLYTPPGDSTDYSISTFTTIYSENAPGEATASSSNPTINPDNFNFPLRQLKSLDVGGWTQNDYISFTYPVAKNATAYTFIRGFIRLKQAVPVNQSLGIQFFNNGTAVSQRISIVNYGLDKNLINQYQNIVIQMNAFGFTSNNFNEVRLNFGGVGTVASGLYLDLFQFQNATAQENSYVTDVYRVPGTTQVKKVIGGQILDAFTDSVGAGSTSTTVDTTSLSNRINAKENPLTFNVPLSRSANSVSADTTNAVTGLVTKWFLASKGYGTGGGSSDVRQSYTSGSTVTLNNTTTWLVVDPSTTVASLTVTTPATPVEAQKIEISFGGTITSGNVVTALTIAANTGQTILQSTAPTSVAAGETISYRYNSGNQKWYRIQ